MAPWSRPAPRPQPTGNPPYHAVGNRQAANPVRDTLPSPAKPAPLEKEVDREAKKLGDKYTDTVDHTIRTSLPNKHHKKCREYVTVVHVYKALLVDVYAHLVYCEYRDSHRQHPLLNTLQQSVSIWQSWDCLKQLTHHVKIRDALNGYLRRDCQHRQLRSHVPEGDKDGILSLIVHCGRAQEIAFHDLAYKSQIQEHDDRMPWKESDVVVDLIHLYLIGPDINPNFRERLFSHTVRLARKSAYFPRRLTMDFGEVRWSENPLPGGSAAASIHLGRYKDEDIVVKWFNFNGQRTMNQFRKAFCSEAILWSTLQHENIVPFYGVITDPRSPNRVGLVSKFMCNRTILHYLATRGVNRKRLAVDIAKALKYIHNLRPPVFHGDLKCDNILVDAYGHARLTDFGQALASDSRRIVDSSSVGRPETPFRYMAPEHLALDDNVHTTSYSDMWSFGCVLYEIITGRILFENLSRLQIIDQIKRGHMPTRPRDLPSEVSALWRVIESCWDSEPKGRLSAGKAVDKLS